MPAKWACVHQVLTCVLDDLIASGPHLPSECILRNHLWSDLMSPALYANKHQGCTVWLKTHIVIIFDWNCVWSQFSLSLEKKLKIVIMWHLFSYIWRIRFLCRVISAAQQYFIATHFPWLKNCSFCDLDIAHGHIAILIILRLIVQP